jgi:hypothetical protein
MINQVNNNSITVNNNKLVFFKKDNSAPVLQILSYNTKTKTFKVRDIFRGIDLQEPVTITDSHNISTDLNDMKSLSGRVDALNHLKDLGIVLEQELATV